MENILKKVKSIGTRIENFVRNTEKTAKAERTAALLKARIQLVERYWSQYLDQHDAMLEKATEEQRETVPYLVDDVFSDIECMYIDGLAWLHEQLSEPGNQTEFAITANSQQDPLPTQQAIKLPKINIPLFSGSYLEWPSFYDSYKSLIHNNCSLTDIQKLHYLKSSVKDDAAKLIQHFPITNSNYESAWNILITRYENKRLLVNVNLESLITLSPMASESTSELRRVLDFFVQPVRALENLQRPVTQWDDWLIYFLANKLDAITRKDWETSLVNSCEIPTFASLQKFLEGRVQTLSALTPNVLTPVEKKYEPKSRQAKPKYVHRMTHFTSTNYSCSSCKGKHMIIFCPVFKTKSIQERRAFVRTKNLCYNCLRPNHDVINCPSEHRCKVCRKKHHTLVHDSDISEVEQHSLQASAHNTSVQQSSPANVMTSVTSNISYGNDSYASVLLATALIKVHSSTGKTLIARALLDQGSETSFISSSIVKSLNLSTTKVKVSIVGVGQCDAGLAESSVTCTISSLIKQNKSYQVTAFALTKVTHLIPSQAIVRKQWPHIEGLPLADPYFDRPAQIDFILGADIYAYLLSGEVRHGPTGTPTAQNTSLGWILSGPIDSNTSHQTTFSFKTSICNIEKLLRKFWETQEPPSTSMLTQDELECENIYTSTQRRDVKGRYIVKLPFKGDKNLLGTSREAAVSALYRMEQRFQINPQLKLDYCAFMREYLTLNHMEPVNEESTFNSNCYYLPHHAVLKPSSTSTKLRVVFNASQRTTSGHSLNDILHCGPKVQNDIFEILLRWRFFPYVLSGDIEKMYRQIWIDTRDTDYQRIVWRENSDQPIASYRLRTVTYGTASAPYLACRTLIQLADDYQDIHPDAATILKTHFYVDDVLFGAYDKDTAIRHRDELRHLLSLGNFKLRKWLANDQELLESISPDDIETSNVDKIVTDLQVKLLGIGWNPSSDTFYFRSHIPASNQITKRTVLSDASRLYDPLGWLSPVTVTSKLFMQKLWLAKLTWDEPLPNELSATWNQYKENLLKINQISINRWIGTTSKNLGIELHGFSDASLLAYGAAVYIRIIHEFDNVQTMLLAAKTKVSPLKTVTLPRLELCGAALLSELLSSIQQMLSLSHVPVHTWTDSTIVLAWLREHPSKWKVYVANRVAFIHEKLPGAVWHHVSSGDNPADCITRGLNVVEVKDNKLWWNGPEWLQRNSTYWPKPLGSENTVPLEEIRLKCISTCLKQDPYQELLYRYSNFWKLLRITAYCYRYYNNMKCCQAERSISFLTTSELKHALFIWLKLIQSTYFAVELACMRQKKPISSTSKLKMLNPYVDESGLLRLGGRLINACLPISERSPIILPNSSRFTELLVLHSHSATLHGGTQLTLHHIRNKYWILNGRSKVRQLIHKCITCCRHRGKIHNQLMGDLPAVRVRPAKPFLHSGVDYAGPFKVTPVKRRGQTAMKTFVAVFICLVTRAVHLELVFDLTADAFIAAFRRFVSRRGRCLKLYSDNATNFIGAAKVLALHFKQLSTNEKIVHALLQENTEWHFIPPATPHFGGIWEAAVKSFKYHFRRVVGDTTLSVEEMGTLLAQIEACLNSRPLHAITDEPDDIRAITPGHFLVGESPTCIPSPDNQQVPENRLTRWELVQKMTQDLWRRWHKDYLHTLQARNKWNRIHPELKLNDLVLVKEDNLPPAKWLLARVTQLYPGADGHVRVANLKTRDGCLKRSIERLCILPIKQPE